LQLLQPYQPNLAVTWLFQRSMSVAVEQSLAPNQINDLLSGVFQEMAKLGEDVLKPFMQDVVQFPALAKTLLKTSLAHPGQVGQVIPQVGIANLLDWTQHYMNLAAYSGLNRVGQACRPWLNQLSPQQQYYWHRRLEAWQYGAGADYRHHA
jgi:lycopene cyclase CruP